MLFSALIIFFLLILSFLFATAKLSVKFEKSPYVNVLYVLMFITFITVLQIFFCIYLYMQFRSKDGEEGPRGYHGFPGDQGDKGKCNQNMCRADTIRIMIEKIFAKKIGRNLNPSEKNIIFQVRALYNTKVKKSKINETDDVAINYLTYDQLKKLFAKITEDVELEYLTLNNYAQEIENYFVLVS